ncbi:unnamed protein product [Thlaspi arvense]|uniref:pyridoxal 5'-phosphate synthase n=1 Tax=Thlaspi arvense TaxID=13288 RepID=A0AAU9S6C4_THLAR|nr:unnamed protein product [Thlaspi arvense]
METVAASSWKQLLLNALESNSSVKHSLFFQLATIGSNGKPSNRTVGFQENSDNPYQHRQPKSKGSSFFTLYLFWVVDLYWIDELKQCPFAEICWYFADSWEQFRINGSVDIIDGSCRDPMKLQQRERAWFSSSPKSRLQYLGPIPGLPLLGEIAFKEPSLDPSTGPVDAFCLLVLDPDQVDYLNLKSNERLNFTSRQNINGEKLWTSQRINP